VTTFDLSQKSTQSNFTLIPHTPFSQVSLAPRHKHCEQPLNSIFGSNFIEWRLQANVFHAAKRVSVLAVAVKSVRDLADAPTTISLTLPSFFFLSLCAAYSAEQQKYDDKIYHKSCLIKYKLSQKNENPG
jgi:hypothetical protein